MKAGADEVKYTVIIHLKTSVVEQVIKCSMSSSATLIRAQKTQLEAQNWTQIR